MRFKVNLLHCCILILVLCATPFQVNAADGLPGFPKFGYGARINVQNEDLVTAITTARNVDLDWLAIDYDWTEIWPSPNIDPDLSQLDDLMKGAYSHDLSVLVSITNPPNWALTKDGPDLELTARIASQLAMRYPATLLAIEPFPGANTQKGWGADPDPYQYANLVKTVHTVLQKVNPDIVVVAAGLEPVTFGPADIDDLTFLKALYGHGSVSYMPVIGLRLSNISTIPTEPPLSTNGNTLRHYESIREIMLQNDHRKGLIWITGFSWDSNTVYSPENQATWLKQAFLMMRAQLYIGTAFIQNLSPFSQTTPPKPISPINHPGIDVIRQIIALDNSQHTNTFEVSLYKTTINQITKNR